MGNISCKYIYKDRDLFDYIIFGDLSPEEFTNNQKIIEELGNAITRVQGMNNGYCLMTVDIKKTHNLLLIVRNDYGTTYCTAKYKVYKITEKSEVENPVGFKLEEIVDDDNLSKFIYESSSRRVSCDYSVSEEDIVSMIMTDTLDGYKINKSLVENFHKEVKKYTGDTARREKLTAYDKREYETKVCSSIVDEIYKTNEQIIGRIGKILERVDEKSKVISVTTQGVVHPVGAMAYGPESTIVISKIADVKKIGNRRIALLDHCMPRKGVDGFLCWSSTQQYEATDGGKLINNDTHYTYGHGRRSVNSALSGIPYNYIDKGRYIVTMGDMNNYNLSVVSNDPMVDPEYKDHLITGTKREVTELLKNNIEARSTRVTDKETDTTLYLVNYEKRGESRKLHNVMAAAKSMSDEFLYVMKRQKSEGSDIKITDKVMYDHAAGKLSYDDFSISIDNESIKETIHSSAKACMRKHFRDEITEQKLIDELVDKYFHEVHRVLNGFSTATKSINICLNGTVNITIESNKGKNNFTYINGYRFNKNEVITIIREMTCYRSNDTAAAFISNVGKLGLSVYMGITSGYVFDEKVYRFKKEKGHSNYKLIIDDINIDIKGKAILNKLYEIVQLNESRYYTARDIQDSIDELLFKSIVTSSDYIKYRFLIDASYAAFMKKSKEFLDKKVTDLDATHVKYHDENRKEILKGIKLTGSSGNDYVIAYDTKESFVFMNPEDHGDENTYKNGTYICMIDQSNIKSNIGYDTVVSKMLSLKNDSMIASQIYNLDEELKK